MKKLLLTILFYSGLLPLLMSGCKRDYPVSRTTIQGGSGGQGGTGGQGGSTPPPPGPSPASRTLKAMVWEYGTNMPLNDVESIILSGNQPDTQRTDNNGSCYFENRIVYFRKFHKAGYWNADIVPDPYYPQMLSPIQGFPFSPVSLFDFNNGFTCDSFIVRLFPEKEILVHVKDSLHLSSCTDCNVIMAVNGLFNNNGNNYTVFTGNSYIGNGRPILLRPGIDSSFRITVFGNALNIISIGEDDAGNGWHGFWNYFRKDTVMVSANTNSMRFAF